MFVTATGLVHAFIRMYDVAKSLSRRLLSHQENLIVDINEIAGRAKPTPPPVTPPLEPATAAGAPAADEAAAGGEGGTAAAAAAAAGAPPIADETVEPEHLSFDEVEAVAVVAARAPAGPLAHIGATVRDASGMEEGTIPAMTDGEVDVATVATTMERGVEGGTWGARQRARAAAESRMEVQAAEAEAAPAEAEPAEVEPAEADTETELPPVPPAEAEVVGDDVTLRVEVERVRLERLLNWRPPRW